MGDADAEAVRLTLRAQARAAYNLAIDAAIARAKAGDARSWVPPDERVSLALNDAERRFLYCGLSHLFGGPAAMTDSLALVIGFNSADHFAAEVRRLWSAIEAGDPLTPADWFRVIATTEIGFASIGLGAAWDWYPVTGIPDEHALLLLRAIQSKASFVLTSHRKHSEG